LFHPLCKRVHFIGHGSCGRGGLLFFCRGFPEIRKTKKRKLKFCRPLGFIVPQFFASCFQNHPPFLKLVSPVLGRHFLPFYWAFPIVFLNGLGWLPWRCNSSDLRHPFTPRPKPKTNVLPFHCLTMFSALGGEGGPSDQPIPARPTSNPTPINCLDFPRARSPTSPVLTCHLDDRCTRMSLLSFVPLFFFFSFAFSAIA